jgi:hypothetical protein
MKRLLLLILAGMFLTTPALANKSASTSPTLLTKTKWSISIIAPNCAPFRVNSAQTAACSQQYYSWLVQRNATITELQIMVADTAEGMSGHCQLELFVENGADVWDVRLTDVDYYINATPAAGDGSSARYNMDVDVTRGQYIGFHFNNYAGILGSTCHSDGGEDPQLNIYVYGEYTD